MAQWNLNTEVFIWKKKLYINIYCLKKKKHYNPYLPWVCCHWLWPWSLSLPSTELNITTEIVNEEFPLSPFLHRNSSLAYLKVVFSQIPLKQSYSGKNIQIDKQNPGIHISQNLSLVTEDRKAFFLLGESLWRVGNNSYFSFMVGSKFYKIPNRELNLQKDF